MSIDEAPNIAGGWLGTYYYIGGNRPDNPRVRFEASFTSSPSGQFEGTILDAHRLLGAANVYGNQHGLSVRFTKAYRSAIPGGRTMRVEYRGTLSEDGQLVRGEWKITGPCHIPLPWSYGTWEARRAWHSEEEPEAVADSESNKHVMREVALV
ncbi:MAG TPA: hypothetical protein VFW40_13220 [Capsulimonadaceae bacterium]|nr:hypothetical protein [Capsulimonadaceae bacterium]